MTKRKSPCLPASEADKLEIVKAICEAISTTDRGLAQILASKPAWPHMSAFLRWVEDDAEIRKEYATAKRQQAIFMEGQLAEMMEDVFTPVINPLTGAPIKIKGKEVQTITQVGIQHAKLKIDTHKWRMARLDSRAYGDRQVIAGDPDAPLNGNKTDLTQLTDDELTAFIALQTKLEMKK